LFLPVSNSPLGPTPIRNDARADGLFVAECLLAAEKDANRKVQHLRHDYDVHRLSSSYPVRLSQSYDMGLGFGRTVRIGGLNDRKLLSAARRKTPFSYLQAICS